jgi:hypothetical protein
MDLAQHRQPVERRQQQVEDDQVPRAAERQTQPFPPVVRRSDAVTLCLQPTSEEGEDPGFVLDHENSHRAPIWSWTPVTIQRRIMTCR